MTLARGQLQVNYLLQIEIILIQRLSNDLVKVSSHLNFVLRRYQGWYGVFPRRILVEELLCI